MRHGSDPIVKSSDPAGGAALSHSGHWPVMQVNEGQTLIGRSGRCDYTVPHASISGQHACAHRRDSRVELEDLDSRFGTYVNTVRIRRQVLQPGDVIHLGNGPPYRFDGRTLSPELGRSGMGLRFQGVGVRGDHGQWLLTDVNVRIEGGQFVGVLGPSGAGKSLFLESLGTLRTPDAGQILFDDNHRLTEELDAFRRQLGQVPQQDLVYPWLTAWENVELAAAIRLPDRLANERTECSRAALQHVGLFEHGEKPALKLSGGQQKRLSVAIELLREPRLLLLDEPTSGLDPGLQGRIMDLLRRLSRRGMTVVCSSHTLDTLNYFDMVVAVGQRKAVGTLAYAGPPDELFTSFGVRHPSDLYDRLQRLDDAAAAGNEPVESVDGRDEGTDRTTDAPSSHLSRSGTRAPRIGVPTAVELTRDHLLIQARSVFQRSWAGFVRDPMTLTMSALQPLVLAFLVILSQHDRGGAVQVHFFLVISALWMGMTLTVREIVRERPLYQRDRLAGLHPDAYLLGRVATALVTLAAQVLLLYGAARGMVVVLFEDGPGETARLNLLETAWLRGLSVLFLAGLGGLLIGLMLSILARTERAAVAMLPLAILPQFLLSRVASGYAVQGWAEPGPFLPLTNIASYWQETEVGIGGLMLLLGSLPLITRPATGSLSMRDETVGVLAGEWMYLLVLLAAHSVVAYLLFRSHEGRLHAR